MPEWASAHSKDTVTSWLCQPKLLAWADNTARIVGGARSIFSLTSVEAVLPAVSVAAPVTTWFAPSLDTVCGGAQNATPERSSPHSKLTWTSVLFQPLAFAAGLGSARIVGGVLSRLTTTLAEAVLPARSLTAASTGWFVRSVEIVCDPGHCTTPEPGSAQPNDTVTSLLCQPASFGSAESSERIVGAAVSMFTVTSADAVFPARSVVVPLTMRFAPFSVTVTGSEHTSMPEPVSVHPNVTVTGVLFQ